MLSGLMRFHVADATYDFARDTTNGRPNESIASFVPQVARRARAERFMHEDLASAAAPRLNMQELQDAEHARRGGNLGVGAAVYVPMIRSTAEATAAFERLTAAITGKISFTIPLRLPGWLADLWLGPVINRIHRNSRRRPKRARRGR